MRVADGEPTLTDEGHRHPPLAAPLEGEGCTHDDGNEIAEHRHQWKDSALRRSEMEVAVAAERRARALAEEVAEHVGRGRSAREVAGQFTVQGRHDIVRSERKPRSCGNRFLPPTGVDRTGDPPLTVENELALLEDALEQHEPKQLQALLVGDRRRLGAGLDRHQ